MQSRIAFYLFETRHFVCIWYTYILLLFRCFRNSYLFVHVITFLSLVFVCGVAVFTCFYVSYMIFENHNRLLHDIILNVCTCANVAHILIADYLVIVRQTYSCYNNPHRILHKTSSCEMISGAKMAINFHACPQEIINCALGINFAQISSQLYNRIFIFFPL